MAFTLDNMLAIPYRTARIASRSGTHHASDGRKKSWRKERVRNLYNKYHVPVSDDDDPEETYDVLDQDDVAGGFEQVALQPRAKGATPNVTFSPEIIRAIMECPSAQRGSAPLFQALEGGDFSNYVKLKKAGRDAIRATRRTDVWISSLTPL
ncbi:hypothetical protein CERZMDRAFT_88099 [Cercospora zeae-maydis SCOH1-5]|uniref:Uncharacterized protein n=1 Tax=Cercospora zeae-maydis SCOH1-5 TaxID=717836 RepID=A0A6A6F6Q6_9PEZI|nr:hypothetical protein CERZMDRAFT_88099 [Cercospora zeae-maydis SCOH1-5]